MSDRHSVIHAIDSHTAGEPTRVVVAGGPDLPRVPLKERVELLRERYDSFRSAVVNEPRGSDVLVGALLCEPMDPTCAAGVIFFNNVGYLGMCGHGTIGLIATLTHLKRLTPGVHRIETCVGIVTTTLHDDGRVTVRNVPSYRARKDVVVDVPGVGRIVGDVAWGGNWFFLVSDHDESIEIKNLDRLMDLSRRIRAALVREGMPEVDHVELFGSTPTADSRNFVLCPGLAYDRSPCGTGTSAKLACLAADDKLKPGEVWRQESVVGTVFEGSIEREGDAIIPSITGRAFITAEVQLLFHPDDPFRDGIR